MSQLAAEGILKKLDVIHNLTLDITNRCTLSCKHCVSYFPYRKEQVDIPLKTLIDSTDRIFRLTDHIDRFVITGGEPLLNKDISKVLEYSLKHSSKIGSIIIITNGTLLFPDELLQLCSRNKDKVQINISDYGCLSKKKDELIEQLRQHSITPRIDKYHGDDMYFDGWVDFTDHSLRCKSPEELIYYSNRCLFNRESTKRLHILNGKLIPCQRSYFRQRKGITPFNEKEIIDLLDNDMPDAAKAERIREWNTAPYLSGCAYCPGFNSIDKRVTPALQLTPGELKNSDLLWSSL